MYLIPTQMQDIETIAKTQSANQAEDAELDSVLLNTDFREGLSRALQRLASSSSTSSATSGEIEGRITLEQFMVVLRQLYSLNGHSYSNNNNNSNNESGIVDVPRSSESAGASAAGTQTPSHPSSTQNSHPPQTPTSSQTSGSTQTPSGSQNVGGLGLGPLIISRFIDRDNDGYITADDIFAAQALVLQRSESFLRVVFRYVLYVMIGFLAALVCSLALFTRVLVPQIIRRERVVSRSSAEPAVDAATDADAWQ